MASHRCQLTTLVERSSATGIVTSVMLAQLYSSLRGEILIVPRIMYMLAVRLDCGTSLDLDSNLHVWIAERDRLIWKA